MRRTLACVAFTACAGPVSSQDTGTVHPAPYLPSPPATVDEMLRLAEVDRSDVVYDLGAGDGRVVIAAARKFGARGVGIEIDGKLVALGQANAERAGVADRVRFVQQDLFQTKLGDATVVALYLSPNLNLRLRPSLLELKPGTRIVSHASDFGDWKPDRASAIRKDVRLWIVPARIAGHWRGSAGTRTLALEFAQRYQQVTASARLDGAAAQVWEARVEGDRIRFVIVDAPDTADEAGLYFDGVARAGVIEGEVARGVGATRSVERWRVERN